MRSLPVANPVSRFDLEQLQYDEGSVPEAGLTVRKDASLSVLSKNDSPDLGFRYTVNPYRGCLHACAYCYARPTHEYLGHGAGTDFDRELYVKPDAPRILDQTLRKFARARSKNKSDGSKAGALEPIVFSGVTDCYQPLEAEWQLTRKCLEVCILHKNPVGIVTKSVLIERDIDVLLRLMEVARLHVAISIPFHDAELARALEPYAPSPERRYRSIQRLTAAGIPVSVLMAPLIPGVSESEVGHVLRAAKQAGAIAVGSSFLRLPGATAKVFEMRIQTALPLRAEKILRRIREARNGKLNDSTFGKRHRGEGAIAEQLHAIVASIAKQCNLHVHAPADHFERAMHHEPEANEPAKGAPQLSFGF
jgi:DNA repair photolyase